MLLVIILSVIFISLYFTVRDIDSLLKKKIVVANVKVGTHRIAHPKFSVLPSLPENDREKVVDRLLKRKYLSFPERKFIYDYLMETGKEKWRYIKGYEGFYRINTYGVVESCRYGRIRIPSVRKDGGYVITLSVVSVQKNYSVHKLVAETFIPNPEGAHLVRPKDGNYSNCDVRNLMWSKKRNPSSISLAA